MEAHEEGPQRYMLPFKKSKCNIDTVCVSREVAVSGLGFNKPSDFWPLESYWGDILGG